MKIILTTLLFALLGQVRAENTNTLAVVLVVDAPAEALVGWPFDTNAIKLAESPAFVDRDFVQYDKKNHTFTVTAESAHRFATQLNPNSLRVLANGQRVYKLSLGLGHGRPFAVLVDGKIIYIGIFHSTLLSLSPHPLPRIDLLEQIPADSKDPVSFDINWGPSREGVDVREDPRILRALKLLGL
jgi:hypothetical protein